MATTRILLFKEANGAVPFLDDLEVLDRRDSKAYAKTVVLVELLAQEGHKLRRPYCDHLRDGIYELRAKSNNVNYRILYFFSNNHEATISHIITKEKTVPPKEIDLAINRKLLVKCNPELHTTPNPQ